MEKNFLSQVVTLKDGRKLGFAECGDPEGPIILEFHGFSDSRMEILLTKIIAPHLKVRYIVMDRPGIGISDPKPNRTLLDWADDVKEFLDILKIPKVILVGFSLGAAYVYGCLYKIPERIIACGIIAGTAPVRFAPEHFPKILVKLANIKGLGNFLAKIVIKKGTFQYYGKTLEVAKNRMYEKQKMVKEEIQQIITQQGNTAKYVIE